jgi:hypothetical protein
MVQYRDIKEKDLNEKKKSIFQFLQRLYKLTGGEQFKDIQAYEIGYDIGFNREFTQEILLYLTKEELVQLDVRDRISITYKGIKAVEDVFSKPDVPTEYFPPFNVIYGKSKAKDFKIRHGSPWAIPIVNIDSEQYEELSEIIESLKASTDNLSLEPNQNAELRADLLSVEAQLSSPSPKTRVINECVSSIIRILEKAPASVIGYDLLSQLLRL